MFSSNISFSNTLYPFHTYTVSINDTIKTFTLNKPINSECTENFILNNNESNIDYIYNAEDYILTESGYQVTVSNTEIRMKAGKVIVLKPDTVIKKGSTYLARIEPCTPCELNFSYPKFFTPNGDSFNDNWKVNWVSENEFTEVSIFDRYGKLIKVLNNHNDFWNGKNESTDIVSSDYWFKLNYTDCNGNSKEFRSHFTLKR